MVDVGFTNRCRSTTLCITSFAIFCWMFWGNSTGCWANTDATYCPSRPSQLAKTNITRYGERGDAQRCRGRVNGERLTGWDGWDWDALRGGKGEIAFTDLLPLKEWHLWAMSFARSPQFMRVAHRNRTMKVRKMLWAQLSLLYSAIHPVCRKVLKIRFGEFPWLVGRFCSYLLPKQTLAPFRDNRYKTLK